MEHLTPKDIIYEEFQQFFWRDLPQIGGADGIDEKDFHKAQIEAEAFYPNHLNIEQDIAKILCMYLIAFWLVYSLKNSTSGGINASVGIQTSKSVDGVSVGYQIPQWLLKSPTMSILASNGYGIKYATQIYPIIRFGTSVIKGKTTDN